MTGLRGPDVPLDVPPDEPLDESFAGPTLSPRLRWLNEPAHWRIDAAARCLRVHTDAGTDFWQRTHYGFEADNGHFLHLRAEGDFVLTTQVTTHPAHQYDQAGLMVRVSPACWLKTSVEFEPEGANRMGAVVTNGQYSDWSTQPLAKDVSTVWFRVRAEACDHIVETSFDGRHWEQIRMARLLERASAGHVSCGLYACSPKAAGCEAAFSFLRFEPGRLG
jgi:regulation of enolase protein 1 (concanavalin A-like superfamily)